MLIRSWNLFHGNSWPPGRKAYLEEMVRLASADRPDVLLLQEVSTWALDHLGDWSGMTAVVELARRPTFGPLPIPTELSRRLTALNPGLLRSAFDGQGNALLFAPGLRVAPIDVLTLNPAGFRRTEAHKLELDLVARLAWAKERRVCQLVRIRRDGAQPLLVAGLHATSSPDDPRIPRAEVRRAADWVDSAAGGEEVVLLGGDFNYVPTEGVPGYSQPGPGIDQLLVRGAEPSPQRTWPEERRRPEAVLLSDHAPVELELP